MGNFTAFNQNSFKSTKFIFAKITRDLKSMGAAGLLDPADWHGYVAEVLKELGCGTYKEEDAVLTVKNGKAKLPTNFKYLYAAYGAICNSDNTTVDKGTLGYEQRGHVLYNDITCEVLGRNTGCVTECKPYDKVLQKITVRNYVSNGDCRTRTWDTNCLLTLVGGIKDQCCMQDSPNIGFHSSKEITINDGYIYTNFSDHDIFLQYYGFPVDKDNIPLIPDIHHIEKAVEWYIKYQILLNGWFDNSIPDIQQRWGKAEQLYNEALAAARYDSKLPAFVTLVNSIRRRRNTSMTTFFNNTIQ